MSGVLDGLRVLDLGEFIAGPYGARLLGDLGADVVKIEPPGGDRLRQHGPFAPGSRSIEGSALFHILNTGKRGEVIDPAQAGARGELDRLLAEADAAILSHGATLTTALDMSPAALRARHPRLIVVKISATPEGNGAAQDADCSLHAAALSGASSVIGDADKAPLPPPYDLLDFIVGAHAASAVLAGRAAREYSGAGQVVEIIASELIGTFVLTPRIDSLLTKTSAYTRSGQRNLGTMGGIYPWGLYPCADGLVAIVAHARNNWKILLDLLDNPAWANDPRFDDPFEIARDYANEADTLLISELRKHTRAELFDRARKKAFALGPVYRIDDILKHEHLHERNSLSTVDVEGRPVTYLKRPMLLSGTPVSEASPPAPKLTAAPAIWRPRAVAAPRAAAGSAAKPLTGFRVLDFSWNWAAPMVGAALADLGAEVIKIEHPGRLDNARLRARPMRNGKPVEGTREEVSYYFHQNNRGKLGATFDLKNAADVAMLWRLMGKSDLVLENFTPGVFDRAGLGYAQIKQDCPRLVWLSMSSAGQFGALGGIRAYAPIMSALAGMEELVAYEGHEASGMLAFALGDMSGGSHALVAALAALHHARRTGQGQLIDFSLTESLMSLLPEAMAEVSLGATNVSAPGMRHARLAPHGNYPCAGVDQWAAISVATDDEWRRLALLLDATDLVADASLVTAVGRLQNRQRIDAAVAAWTRARTRSEAVAQLQREGLRATPVLAVAELVKIWPEDISAAVDHPVVGHELVLPLPWRASALDVKPARPAPLVGQHMQYVLHDVLGLSPADVEKRLGASAAA